MRADNYRDVGRLWVDEFLPKFRGNLRQNFPKDYPPSLGLCDGCPRAGVHELHEFTFTLDLIWRLLDELKKRREKDEEGNNGQVSQETCGG